MGYPGATIGVVAKLCVTQNNQGREELSLSELPVWPRQRSLSTSLWFDDTKTWKTKVPEYISQTLMKTDIILPFLPLSFHLICWHNTGERQALFEQRTHSRLCVLRYCQHCVSQAARKRGSFHWKEIRLSELLQFDRDVSLNQYLSSLHFYTRAERGFSRRQRRELYVLGKEWDVIDGAICFPSSSAATHEQPRTSSAVCVIGRKREERERERMTEWRGSHARVSRESCSFQASDLIYANSTCRQSFQHHNFMVYLLWKYFDGKSYSVFMSSHTPALHRWGFCTRQIWQSWLAGCQNFTRLICSEELCSPTVKVFLPWSAGVEKHLAFPCITHMILIQDACHRRPIPLNVKSTIGAGSLSQDEQTETMEKFSLGLSNELAHDGKTLLKQTSMHSKYQSIRIDLSAGLENNT